MRLAAALERANAAQSTAMLSCLEESERVRLQQLSLGWESPVGPLGAMGTRRSEFTDDSSAGVCVIIVLLGAAEVGVAHTINLRLCVGGRHGAMTAAAAAAAAAPCVAGFQETCVQGWSRPTTPVPLSSRRALPATPPCGRRRAGWRRVCPRRRR